MSKTIIISGCKGQDGGLMCDYLIKLYPDYNIIGLYNKWHNEFINYKINYIYADITDKRMVDDIIKCYKPDYFINFAGESFVGASWENPVRFFNTNATSVLYILEAIKAFAPECRFFSAGSIEEWGENSLPKDINSPLKPENPYAVSKVAAHNFVEIYRYEYGLWASHCILSNHESPRRSEKFITKKIIAGLIRIIQGKQKEPIQVGNLCAQKDWGWAEDYIIGIWKALNMPYPEDYIFSTGQINTVHDIARETLKYFNFACDNYNDNVSNYPNNKVIVTNLEFYRPHCPIGRINSTFTQQILKWKPETDFPNLIKKMIEAELKGCYAPFDDRKET